MDTLTEVFLEAWDDAQQARQKCEARSAELERQGYHCSIHLFYNALSGKRIYLLEATSSAEAALEAVEEKRGSRTPASRPQRKKPSRATAFENR